MKKSDLEKLRTLNAIPSMINALSLPGKEMEYYHRKAEYRYHLAARVQQLNGLLKVSVCTREDIEAGNHTPKWDIFVNYEGDEYITRERQQDGSYKWRETMCDNLEDYNWYSEDFNEYCYINPEGELAIKKILKTERKGWDGLADWQHQCKKRRDDKRIKARTDKWDEEMKPIKEPPKGFEEWAKRNMEENFIFYRKAKETQGYCTGHLGAVPLSGKQKHNTNMKCPICHKKVTLISRAIKKLPIWSAYNIFLCIQAYPGGIVERQFGVQRVDRKDEEGGNRSEYLFNETVRGIIIDSAQKVYEYTDYRRRGTRWAETERDAISWAGKMFTRNLKSVLKDFNTSYPIAAKHNRTMLDFWRFARLEKQNPEIELLYKAGITTLAEQIVNKTYEKIHLPRKIDYHQKTLAKKLWIDGARLKRLKENSGGIVYLSWLQQEKIEDTAYRDEDLKVMDEICEYPEEFKKSKVGKYLSVRKAANYIKKQTELRDKTKASDIWRDWNDYISMLEKEKMDCSREILLKPKDLKIAHNEMVAEISVKNASKEIKKLEKKYTAAVQLLESGELEKYRFEDDDFCVVVPRSISDIFREGTILKHCIHTCEIYFGRINTRETYLVFLRRKAEPDKPWYTLEIEPGGNIRQKKSVLNEAYSDLKEAMPFLRKYQKEIGKRMTEKDRELAGKSDKARKDGYKKLREEKKVVWHGSYKGKLLADALESDFMPAV